MNKDIIKGNWKEVQGKLKQQWGKLTDNDIATMQGSYEELDGKLQATYGYARDKVKTEIDAFIKLNNFKDQE